MVNIYVKLILTNKKTLEDVLMMLKGAVKNILSNLGLEDLAK